MYSIIPRSDKFQHFAHFLPLDAVYNLAILTSFFCNRLDYLVIIIMSIYCICMCLLDVANAGIIPKITTNRGSNKTTNYYDNKKIGKSELQKRNKQVLFPEKH